MYPFACDVRPPHFFSAVAFTGERQRRIARGRHIRLPGCPPSPRPDDSAAGGQRSRSRIERRRLWDHRIRKPTGALAPE